MNRNISLRQVIVGLVLTCVLPSAGRAQVVEERHGEANPTEVIFRSTLYGAGTGLLLGGAYSLVKSDDVSTWEVLRWSVAGGAAAGALIGVIYVLARPEPKGSAGEVGSRFTGSDRDGPRLIAPDIAVTALRGSPAQRLGEVRLKVVNMTF